MTVYQLGALGGIFLILILMIGLILTIRSRLSQPSQSQAHHSDLAALNGQLSQLTALASNQQLAQSEQMASLSKRLDDSLAAMNDRMSRSLAQQSERTHENLNRLSERLAVIDAANSQISALTNQVTQLHMCWPIKPTEVHSVKSSLKIWCVMFCRQMLMNFRFR